MRVWTATYAPRFGGGRIGNIAVLLATLGACSAPDDDLRVVFTLYVPSTTLPDAIAGEPYEATLVAVHGHPPYRWSFEGSDFDPVPGLALDRDGVLRGTPTEAGRYTFLAQVFDASTVASGPQSLRVLPGDPPDLPDNARCDGATELLLGPDAARVASTLPSDEARDPSRTCGHIVGEAEAYYTITLPTRGALALTVTGSEPVRAGLAPDGCPTYSAVSTCASAVSRPLDAGRWLIVVKGPPESAFDLAVDFAPAEQEPGTCEAPREIDLTTGHATLVGSLDDAPDDERLSCAQGEESGERVYRFTLAYASDLRIASPSHARFALRGRDCAGSEIACRDGHQSLYVPALVPGSYHLVVETDDPEYVIDIDVSIATSRPSNDACGTGLRLPIFAGSGELTISFAAALSTPSLQCGAGPALYWDVQLTEPSILRFERQEAIGIELLDERCATALSPAACGGSTACTAPLAAGRYVLRVSDQSELPPLASARLRYEVQPVPTTPLNDACAGAAPLPAGPTTARLGAARDDVDACGVPGALDVFYAFDLPEESDVIVTPDGFDTRFGLIAGGCGARDLGCRDVWRRVPAGRTILVVERWASGDACESNPTPGFTLSAVPSPPVPEGDHCTTTATLAFAGIGDAITIRGTTHGATDDSAQLSCRGGNVADTSGGDVSFTLSLPVAGRVRLTPLTSGSGMVFSLHQRCSDVAAYACGDSSGTLDTGGALPAGTYTLRVDSYDWAGSQSPSDFSAIAELY